MRLSMVFLGGLVLLALVAVLLAWLSTGHFTAFGGKPELARLRGSPQFIDVKFQNLEPTSMMPARRWFWVMREWLFGGHAYSGLTRAPIPAPSGHRFRNDAGAKSGGIRALIPV